MTRRPTKRRSHKAGLPPGTVVHIGERRSELTQIRIVHYDAASHTEREATAIAEGEVLRASAGTTWVHVVGVHDATVLERIGKSFGLHPLVIEDISNTDQRPKLEDYGDYAYLVIKGIRESEMVAAPIEQISIVVGADFVLSFEESGPSPFENVRARLREARGMIRAAGADHLAYSLLDAVVDNYFIVLERMGERIEQLQDRLLAGPNAGASGELQALKRESVHLRRAVWPLREVLGSLERGRIALFREETRLYLRDVYDHVVHIVDTIESYRDLLANALDIYLMSLSNRMNEIMKVLTIIATIFIPLSFIAGVYGMNFRHMPELDWPWGYPLVLLVMVAVGGGMLRYFRRKKWI